MRTNILITTLAAVSTLFSFSHSIALAAADDAYNPNDVLLFFQNPAGTTGTDKVLYYSLGSSWNVFRNATTGATISLGNIGANLTATYGSDWTGASASIFVGGAGQNGATSQASTSASNGDYARTVYITKPRSGVGTVGLANSASPLFDPSQTSVASNIAGSNNISGMTQPGAALLQDTILDGSNPISNGNPSTAYGAIQGGIIGPVSSPFSIGNISTAVMALDLYRVAKTTGTNSSNSTLWHISNNITATYTDSFTGGGARADFLGTIVVSANGDVNFIARGASPPVAQIPVITSAGSANATVGTPFSYTITASNNATSFAATLSQTAGAATANLSVNTATGLISGTPINPGIAPVPISATNAAGTGNASLTLTIAPAVTAPAITSNTSASGRVGTEFSYQIAASNNPTSFGATGLPAGLAVNSTTGLVSGTPTTPGNSSVSLSATNAGGTGNATLAISIVPQPPGIQSALSASAESGRPFIYQITASNNPTSFGAAGLPPGLSVNSTTGLISGTPPAVGNSSVTISATNAGGTGNASLSLRVTPAPAAAPKISSPTMQTARIGQAFSYQIAATNNPTSFGATGLPGDLTINPATGLVSGTPGTLGNFTVALRATNSRGTGNATLRLSVLPLAPVVSANGTANGIQGGNFTYQISATNNPTRYSATGLPAGLTVNASTGLISGNPTQRGNSTVALAASNAGGNGTAVLRIQIVAPPAPQITSLLAANGTVGANFTYQISATNNATRYSATGLPAGLTLNAATGLISGNPTQQGNSTVALAASNAGGNGTAVLRIQIVLPPAPQITSLLAANGTVGANFTYQITALNNPLRYAATGLPPGLAVNAATGLISGKPTRAGNSTVSLSTSNAGGNGTASLAISIRPKP